MIFRRNSVEIFLTIPRPIHDPMNARIKSMGMSCKYSRERNPWPKYSGIRVKSTRSAMDAIVAIYCSFASPNTVINAPRRTHPVPISHAVNHDNALQILQSRGGRCYPKVRLPERVNCKYDQHKWEDDFQYVRIYLLDERCSNDSHDDTRDTEEDKYPLIPMFVCKWKSARIAKYVIDRDEDDRIFVVEKLVCYREKDRRRAKSWYCTSDFGYECGDKKWDFHKLRSAEIIQYLLSLPCTDYITR